MQESQPMNQRNHTNYLCPDSSFLSGMGSVIVINGQYFQYNYSENPDELAIFSDWLKTGEDIENAIEHGEMVAAEDER